MNSERQRADGATVSKGKILEIFDWERAVELLLISRALDELEETKLLPERKVLYQFSARGHDLAQIILGLHLTHTHDAASGYYRSRPLLLSVGLSVVDALAGPMGKSGGFSDGRDIGVVCNFPNSAGTKILPMAGGVGTQYTPTMGWAYGLQYRQRVLQESDVVGGIAVALGGDGSVATNGFWSALNVATTQRLPMLFYIEDNQYGLSVPSVFQTPGGNIAENLASYKNLKILSGDGTDPCEALSLISEGVRNTRAGNGPVLLRLTVPRLSGHSGQDTQAYKSESFVEQEQAQDPLPKLRAFLENRGFPSAKWKALEEKSAEIVASALDEALNRPEPDPSRLYEHRFWEEEEPIQIVGGLRSLGISPHVGSINDAPEAQRINMLTAIRRTLAHELSLNERVVLFGEDIGPKGGVHGATLGLQEEFGADRVSDTSLSEEGIIGRAVGMAYAGLLPVAEIQFRKYADPAHEQLIDCGTIRWRTNNRFAAPIVVRTPGGFSKCGDPWHSVSDEVMFTHAIGWQVAFPSNAADAVGLLRSAMRSNNPTFFFEHRYLLDAPSARVPYPGDEFVVPFGVAKTLTRGNSATLITWGAMVERALEAASRIPEEVEVIDLRTLMPWDREAVLQSVEKTGRALILHEDSLTAGFGAEIAAVLSSEAFLSLKAPVERLAVRDIPMPYNVSLLQAALPSVEQIEDKLYELMEFDG
ncbi:MAG: hypothetical protein KDD64_08700 [Bdellovibrionales bacterium]|nr:hypothetical protein [Bdellovibrionales bacterium]